MNSWAASVDKTSMFDAFCLSQANLHRLITHQLHLSSSADIKLKLWNWKSEVPRRVDLREREWTWVPRPTAMANNGGTLQDAVCQEKNSKRCKTLFLCPAYLLAWRSLFWFLVITDSQEARKPQWDALFWINLRNTRTKHLSLLPDWLAKDHMPPHPATLCRWRNAAVFMREDSYRHPELAADGQWIAWSTA